MYSITFRHIEPGMEPIRLDQVSADQSLLEVAIAHSIGLEHQCGGMCSCATCQVFVEIGNEFLEFKSKREEDYLKKFNKSGDYSRLACQCILLPGKGEILITLPAQIKI